MWMFNSEERDDKTLTNTCKLIAGSKNSILISIVHSKKIAGK